MSIQPARAELIALLAAMRPDWHRASIERALWDATHSGMTFEHTLRTATRVALDASAAPNAISHANALPAQGKPGDYAAGAEAARAALHESVERRG